jgi:hypothetical protein
VSKKNWAGFLLASFLLVGVVSVVDISSLSLYASVGEKIKAGIKKGAVKTQVAAKKAATKTWNAVRGLVSGFIRIGIGMLNSVRKLKYNDRYLRIPARFNFGTGKVFAFAVEHDLGEPTEDIVGFERSNALFLLREPVKFLGNFKFKVDAVRSLSVAEKNLGAAEKITAFFPPASITLATLRKIIVALKYHLGWRRETVFMMRLWSLFVSAFSPTDEISFFDVPGKLLFLLARLSVTINESATVKAHGGVGDPKKWDPKKIVYFGGAGVGDIFKKKIFVLLDAFFKNIRPKISKYSIQEWKTLMQRHRAWRGKAVGNTAMNMPATAMEDAYYGLWTIPEYAKRTIYFSKNVLPLLNKPLDFIDRDRFVRALMVHFNRRFDGFRSLLLTGATKEFSGDIIGKISLVLSLVRYRLPALLKVVEDSLAKMKQKGFDKGYIRLVTDLLNRGRNDYDRFSKFSIPEEISLKQIMKSDSVEESDFLTLPVKGIVPSVDNPFLSLRAKVTPFKDDEDEGEEASAEKKKRRGVKGTIEAGKKKFEGIGLAAQKEIGDALIGLKALKKRGEMERKLRPVFKKFVEMVETAISWSLDKEYMWPVVLRQKGSIKFYDYLQMFFAQIGSILNWKFRYDIAGLTHEEALRFAAAIMLRVYLRLPTAALAYKKSAAGRSFYDVNIKASELAYNSGKRSVASAKSSYDASTTAEEYGSRLSALKKARASLKAVFKDFSKRRRQLYKKAFTYAPAGKESLKEFSLKQGRNLIGRLYEVQIFGTLLSKLIGIFVERMGMSPAELINLWVEHPEVAAGKLIAKRVDVDRIEAEYKKYQEAFNKEIGRVAKEAEKITKPVVDVAHEIEKVVPAATKVVIGKKRYEKLKEKIQDKKEALSDALAELKEAIALKDEDAIARARRNVSDKEKDLELDEEALEDIGEKEDEDEEGDGEEGRSP